MTSDSRKYHELSKHRLERILSASILDWGDEPRRIKEYPRAQRFELPQSLSIETSLEDLLNNNLPGPPEQLSLPLVSTALELGYGVTSRAGGFAFRAAPSAGALYPAELYICCGDLDGLSAGIYYYNPIENTLFWIREGDYRSAVNEASPDGSPADAHLIVTAIPYRSGWKYRQRAYRYCYFDSGHLAGNLLLIGSATGLSPGLVSLFNQETLDDLLGLDGESEFVTAVVGLHSANPQIPASAPANEVRNAEQLCSRPVRDQDVLAAQKAESYAGLKPGVVPPDLATAGVELPQRRALDAGLAELIRKRRSHRRKARSSAALEDVAAFLDSCFQSYPADWMPVEWRSNMMLDAFLVAFDVQSLPEGIYRYNAAARVLVPTDLPLDLNQLASACLGQRFITRANAFLVPAFDFTRLPDRGCYRIGLLDAGIVGQFAYLAAEALGAGCCGIGAFFDNELSALFGLDGRDRNVLYGLTLAMK